MTMANKPIDFCDMPLTSCSKPV